MLFEKEMLSRWSYVGCSIAVTVGCVIGDIVRCTACDIIDCVSDVFVCFVGFFYW